MNLKQLEVFIAVAESGSFSKGADITCITQSTVSQHVSGLENILGVRLLDRTGKGAFPTPAGKMLLKLARQVVADVDRINSALQHYKGIEDVSLRVGGSTIPGGYMIPDALPVLINRFPRLTIVLIEGDSQDVLDKLSREELEIGIIGSRFPEKGFTFQPFASERLILVAGQSHPLVSRSAITFDDLAQEDFILREPGSGTGKTLTEALRIAGFDIGKLSVRAYLGSNESVKHAIANGLGISFVSELSVKKELERGDLVKINLSGFDIQRNFYFVTRTGRDLSPAAKAFYDVMTELYGP